MGYESGRRCDVCGCESPWVPTCDGCSTAQRYEEQMDTALTTARAEGYAECQADVVAYLRRIAGTSTLTATTFAASRIDAGAHVGAAKKGGE